MGDGPDKKEKGMNLSFNNINLLRLGVVRRLSREDSFLWANTVRLFPILAFSTLIIAVLILSLSSIWINNVLTRGAVSFFAGGYIVVSAIRFAACFSPLPDTPISQQALHSLEFDWPRYSVFVPLYNEPTIVRELIGHLSKLDYPEDKLDITLICERDDIATITALWNSLEAPFSIAIVDPGGPKTKPNALNFALERTDSDLITIYDAEDRPDPMQLKMAAYAFHKHPKWGALQAPLLFHNARKNWLTRQFALEYAALFYVWLPFLSRLGLPFPLGGTSNHIRRSLLDKIGGWDSHNVTEDADLSFRIAILAKNIGYILPPTTEEVVDNWPSWVGQRSRWMKGFMQTFNIHMHAPFKPGGYRGVIRFLTLQITIGVTLLTGFCHLPFLSVLAGSRLGGYVSGTPINLPPVFLICLLIGYLSGILCAFMGAWRSRQFFLLKDTAFMPIYWIALFGPTLRAAIELKNNPFYWNKTQHGPSLNINSLPPS